VTRRVRALGELGLRLASPPRLVGASRRWAVVAGVVAVLAIGLIDYATPASVYITALFVLPVAVVAIYVGPASGVVLGAEAAAVWGVADQLEHRTRGLAVPTVNSLLRIVLFGAVVLLLTGLRTALDRARESNRRSREFLAFAAHQLRTPVSGIRASAEALLLSPGRDPEEERLLGNLVNESARAGRLVADLLRIARLDQGEDFPAGPVDVAAVSRAAAGEVASRAPDLDVQVRANGAVVVEASADALHEAVANLLDNARRHARSAISVDVSADPRAVTITVADDGVGVPAGLEEQVFERFFSGDRGGGAGLGLPIARGLVRAQGGDLRYDAAAARFVIELPR
jgi:signal transduction histidine kinase